MPYITSTLGADWFKPKSNFLRWFTIIEVIENDRATKFKGAFLLYIK